LAAFARSWILLVALLSACASLPPNTGRTESHAARDTAGTHVGQVVAGQLAKHPGQNAFRPLSDDAAALHARLALAEAAELSIDVQYYIWHDDASGRQLADALVHAADRGVRVRVLLDDVGTQADDRVLRLLDVHPNIEIRLFNPVASRSLRSLGMLWDFARTNRRMHNKAFIADNQVAILGGRNIGDEYFGVSEEFVFDDLDVLSYGPVVPRVSRAFDSFWNAPASYPVATLSEKPPDPAALTALRDALAQASAEATGGEASARDPLMAALGIGAKHLYWGRARLIHDGPDKIEREPDSDDSPVAGDFFRRADRVSRELTIVSAYFVPGKAGLAWFSELAARGVRVTILTNSLAASDVAAVHAGYARYREALLEAGVRLYELKPLPSPGAKPPLGPGRSSGSGSSQASLHAKTFMFDRSAVYIGSLNLDPRSVKLNTEIGLLCESPPLTEELLEALESSLDKVAWRLALEPDDSGRKHLVWIETEDDGTEKRFTDEPGAGWWRRASVWMLGLLPIESQL
jgi:putative cardiolipin synthase